MKQSLTVTDWLTIPIEHREKFRLMFTIHKSTGIQTIDNVVTCDGSTGNDLKVFNIGAMILALWQKDVKLMAKVSDLLKDCTTLCDNLFKLTFDTFTHVEQPIESNVSSVGGSGETDSITRGTEEAKSKRRGRPPRQAVNLQAGVQGV